MRPIVSLLMVALLSVLSAGCDDTPTSPTDSAPISQTDLRLGTGAEAVTNTTLTVHYTGWFYNGADSTQKGAMFDSSAGGTGFEFTLGVGQVIAGWDRGVAGMKVGGLRRLVVPPSLGYGPVRSGVIPPNATLLFEVELLAVETRCCGTVGSGFTTGSDRPGSPANRAADAAQERGNAVVHPAFPHVVRIVSLEADHVELAVDGEAVVDPALEAAAELPPPARRSQPKRLRAARHRHGHAIDGDGPVVNASVVAMVAR